MDIESIGFENIKVDPSGLTIKETFSLIKSSSQGLTEEDVKLRLSEYGRNDLPEKKQDSNLKIFLNNFKSPLVYALMAAAILATILGKILDTIVILIVILVNAIIGYIQEIKAKKDIDALKKLSVFKVKVFRGGRYKAIDSSLLVPGDVVYLEEGIRIPADGRLIETNNLLVNESALTGESELVLKTEEKINQKSQITSKNMVYQGTVVAEGNGQFLVLSTGVDTMFGKIALYAQESQTDTPIQNKIKKLSKQFGITVILASIFIFFVGVLGGYGIVNMIQLSVSLAVSAIPEGLPIAVTIIFVLGAKRMAKRKAIVRNMMAVETLGATTVIATDKTGTLTHNKLKVIELYTDTDYHFEPENEGSSYYKNNKKYYDDKLERVLLAGAICNNADINRESGEIVGEATDAALLENALKLGIKKQEYKRLDEVPFTSQKRYMAILGQSEENEIIFLKGAPEEILEKCNYSMSEKTKMSGSQRKRITKQVSAMSLRGLRVVAVAEKKYDKNFASSLENGFTYLGLIGMKDTYRTGVRESIAKCREAGIRIIMLTGDHLDTATAIAKKLSIIDDDRQAIIAQNYFTDNKKAQKLDDISVFARILPEFKYKIIGLLKEKGEIVAMTGDGVNDVPALRKADIGIAMGVSGTDAAKEAADIVLADDNFSTIVSAVEEGRTIFANLRKTLLYLASTSIGEVLAVLGSMILSFPLPITPLQILWINLITETAVTIPLGVEPKEANHLKGPPRKQKEGLISGLIIRRGLLAGLYMGAMALVIFWASLPYGLDYARTITFLFLTISQWVNAFNCRSEKKSVFKVNPLSNITLIIGIAIGIVLQVAVMYLPVIKTVFGFVPVGFNEWGVAIIAALGLILLIEIDKLISSRIKARLVKN